MRWQFSIAKLFLCVTVYAVPLALLSGYGREGLWHALAVGTSLSGVILLTNKRNLGLVANAYWGGLIGAFGGWMLGAGLLGPNRRDIAACGIAGTIVGVMLSASLIRRNSPGTENGKGSESLPVADCTSQLTTLEEGTTRTTRGEPHASCPSTRNSGGAPLR